jgi:hypothetical protein
MTTPHVRVIPKGPYYLAQPVDNRLYLRFSPTTGRVSLDIRERCTWFRTRSCAERAIAARLGAVAVDVIRCDP